MILCKQMFSVGDKVIIKKRHYKEGDYRYNFNNDMASLEGNVCTILRVDENKSIDNLIFLPDDNKVYTLKENGYMWASSMLEPYREN